MKRYPHIVSVAQMIAKNFHDGIHGLAQAMGKNSAILSHKLSPTFEGNHLSLEEAAFITEATQSHAIADALAALINRITVALPDADVSMRDLTMVFCRVVQECGDVGRELVDAQSPASEWGEQISPAERKRIDKELTDLISVAAGLRQRVQAD
ncbi:phage regulatory CII family protein [Chitinimonas sp. BJB300]|uniref:phage regulatory CII family protein n=1 Tax=Chitinimonas sp. BJB300 TaxID=1559339 RepID=UPI000C0F2D27|nr:phage regulatory CII family protein [Chitinimonas sp. BJB300]PHV10902.1 hypothetical protein CSQ89_13800 [Chitinimonas sp. BJB300]TSJ88189.1 hypothetical protein FG002_011805 [Chitinimonas sp. BJB300]